MRYGYTSDDEEDDDFDEDASNSDSEVEDLHPTKYERQAVLQVQQDQALAPMASRLYSKHPTKSAQYNWFGYAQLECVMGEPAPLPANSRIYLVGHGDTSLIKLGNENGQYVAARLAQYAQPGRFARISVVGCYTTATSEARNPQNFQMRVTNNFAQQLHYHLGIAHKVWTSVSGRGVCVWVDEDDDGKIEKKTATASWNSQLKIYEPAEPRQHQRPGDKIIYYWEGSPTHPIQKWKYAY